MNPNRIIGIMGAMPQEIDGVVGLLVNKQEATFGMRTYYTGTINGIKTVVVFSRWGKVAAATTVSTLMHEYKITELVFTGVAGAIAAQLKIGDIVLGNQLIQHDMDARPLMQQFEIPLLGKTYFETNKALTHISAAAINTLLEEKQLHKVFTNEVLQQFNITQPQLHIGTIASGDTFFANNKQKQALHNVLPNVLCVEMEGAAVAQVCYEYVIPFTVIRTISDTADENSAIDFPLFIQNVSSKYSVEIIQHIYKALIKVSV